jgi:DNA-binding transcriptional LysR family regulator
MNITFEQINAFKTVAKHRSFSIAARELHRTQSAVSIQVANLEENISQRVFHRTTKTVTLTEAGRILLKCVKGIERIIDETEQELNDLHEMERGRLMISTSDTTACYRIPDILQEYREKYPKIEIVVRNSTSLKSIEMVMRGDVDFGIVTLSYLKPELEMVPLFSRSDVLICHPEHPLSERKKVFLKDLEKYSLVLLDQNCSSRRILDDACERAKVDLSIGMELSSIEVVKSFVAINAGISIAPEESVREEVKSRKLKAIRVVEFEGEKRKRMGIIYRKDRYLSIASRRFLEISKQNAARLI